MFNKARLSLLFSVSLCYKSPFEFYYFSWIVFLSQHQYHTILITEALYKIPYLLYNFSKFPLNTVFSLALFVFSGRVYTQQFSVPGTNAQLQNANKRIVLSIQTLFLLCGFCLFSSFLLSFWRKEVMSLFCFQTVCLKPASKSGSTSANRVLA